MFYCADCQGVHFPGQCRRPQGALVAVSFTFVYGAPTPYVPEYDSFALPEEQAAKLCRPCSKGDRVEGKIHSCDGPPCECPFCREIAPLLQELSDDWDMRDRERNWPSR